MSKKIYALHDNELSEYVAVTSLNDVEVKPYFTELANDVRSPYYQRVKDFDCICLGLLIDETGVIDYDRHLLCPLSNYVDEKRVEYQRIVQILNYIPAGYFKMPAEMQEGVQEQIANAVKDYVEKYADVDKLYSTVSKNDTTDMVSTIGGC